MGLAQTPHHPLLATQILGLRGGKSLLLLFEDQVRTSAKDLRVINWRLFRAFYPFHGPFVDHPVVATTHHPFGGAQIARLIDLFAAGKLACSKHVRGTGGDLGGICPKVGGRILIVGREIVKDMWVVRMEDEESEEVEEVEEVDVDEVDEVV